MATREVLSLPKRKEASEAVDREEAGQIIRKNIYKFLQRKSDRLGIELIEFDKSEDGFLFDPGGRVQVRSMEREALRAIMAEIMVEFEAKEEGKPRRRTEVNTQTNKIIPDSYREYRRYTTPNKDLAFKVVQEFKEGNLEKGWVAIDGIHRGSIVQSSLPPKQSR